MLYIMFVVCCIHGLYWSVITVPKGVKKEYTRHSKYDTTLVYTNNTEEDNLARVGALINSVRNPRDKITILNYNCADKDPTNILQTVLPHEDDCEMLEKTATVPNVNNIPKAITSPYQ